MSNTNLFHHSGPVDVNSCCCSQNCSKSNFRIILYHTFTSLTLVILFLLEVSLSSEPSTHTGPVWLLQDLPLRTIQCHMMTFFFLLITIDMQIFPPLWNTKFSSSQLRFWLFQIPIKFVSSSCFAIADSGSAVQLVDWVYLFYQVPFGQYFMDDVLFEFY